MRYLLVLLMTCGANAAEFRVHNLSGHPWTNDAQVFGPGDAVLPMDAHTVAVFTEITSDGSQSFDVYFDDLHGETVVTAERDASYWFWFGFLVALGAGAFAFTLRMIKQIGRSSPEL